MGTDLILTTLWQQDQAAIYATIHRYIADADTVKDLHQEVFIHIYLNWDKYNSDMSFRPWACRVARNLTISHLRKQKKYSNISDFMIDYSFMDSYDLEGDVINQDNSQFIGKKVQSLIPKEQMLVDLYYYQGFSQKEISGMTGMPTGTIKKYLSDARKNLKGKMIVVE